MGRKRVEVESQARFIGARKKSQLDMDQNVSRTTARGILNGFLRISVLYISHVDVSIGTSQRDERVTMAFAIFV
jgi:hypothetical protein